MLKTIYNFIKKQLKRFWMWFVGLFIIGTVLAGSQISQPIEPLSIDTIKEQTVITEGYDTISKENLEVFGVSAIDAEKLSNYLSKGSTIDIKDRYLIEEYAKALNEAKKMTGDINLGQINSKKHLLKKMNYLITETAKIKRASLLK